VISQAYRGGFLSGFPDQTFHPQQNLRRIELITSLANGLSLPNADAKVLEIYEDRDSIPAYAKPAVAAATQAGIVVNYPTPNAPTTKREATRAEATAFVYQALERTGRVSAINSPYIVSKAAELRSDENAPGEGLFYPQSPIANPKSKILALR
jgi:hypothetical protein